MLATATGGLSQLKDSVRPGEKIFLSQNNDDVDPGNKRHGDSEHAIEQAAYDPAHQYAIIKTAQNLPYAQSSIYIRSTICLKSTNLQ